MQNGESSERFATHIITDSLEALNRLVSDEKSDKEKRFSEQRTKSYSPQTKSGRNLGQSNDHQISDTVHNSRETASDNLNDITVHTNSNSNSPWASSDVPIAAGASPTNENPWPLSQGAVNGLGLKTDDSIKTEEGERLISDMAKLEPSSLNEEDLAQRDLKESILHDLLPPSNVKSEDALTGLPTQESTPQSEDEDKPAFASYPCSTAEAMTTYQHITANIYKGSATGKSIAEESMPCECKYEPGLDYPEAACGDDDVCINRMMFMECMEDDCPCGRYCRNRRFQLQQYSSVDVIRTEKKGYGLRALADFESNQFIMEYIGEVIPNSEFIRRTKEYGVEGVKHFYFMTLKSDEIIDATRKGCLARFINHSCRPNCVTQKWVIGKTMRIGIFTSRDIKAGEELTFDYKFERYGAVAQPCYCGEPNCKGVIGGGNAKYSLGDQTAPDSEQSEDEAEMEALDLSAATPKTKLMKKDQIRKRMNRPLESPDEVQLFVKKMLGSVGKAKLVEKLLYRLEMTESTSSNGREILKKFVRLHGLKMLKFWLGEWKNESDIVKKVLHVLERLPLANRNGLEDSDMFEVMKKYTEYGDEDIELRAQSLLDEWSELKSVYRIPKRVYTEQPKEVIMDSMEDTHVDNQSVNETDTNQNQSHSKKRRYSSSRDFYEPPNDYYEHLPFNISLEDMEQRLRFPPVVSIPTAPKAMLAAAAASAALAAQNAMMYSNSTDQSAPTYYPNSVDLTNGAAWEQTDRSQSTPAIPDTYSAHKDPSAYNSPRSAVTLAAEDAALPTGPAAMQPYANFNRSQMSRYSSPTTDVSTQPMSYTPTSSGAEFYKLPPNWKAAYSAEGNVYYYNSITNQTQWEPPEQKVSSIEGVDQSQLDGLVASTIMEAERRKKLAISTPEQEPKRPVKVSKSQSSTIKSDITSKALSEVELKKEIGKVVTKYLSSKQKALWQGDKQLFKELARKQQITHHIVDREAQSSRKVQTVNSALRTKIEGFIDSHGVEVVNKLKRKRRSDRDDQRSKRRYSVSSRTGENDDQFEGSASVPMDCSSPSTSQDITPMQDEGTPTLSSLHSSTASPPVRGPPGHM
ncbi:hypothetical protein NQZ79_g2632 [Umbelopsis isabellina]|nr:hypothetical protein NQZ79_g2632 [Umbelopsis isabellina]